MGAKWQWIGRRLHARPAKDKHESVIDFAINYKAGQEVDDMQTQLRRIESELAELKLLLRAEREVKLNEEEEKLN